MSTNSPRIKVKHRETARTLMLDERNRVLLMYTHWDPGTGLPPRWLTPGGGIDEGEQVSEAAVRELFEETGLVVTPEELGDQIGSIAFEIDWTEGRYETGVAHFFRFKIPSTTYISFDNWTNSEWRDIIELRWWSLDELVKSNERFGPPGLIDFICAHS